MYYFMLMVLFTYNINTAFTTAVNQLDECKLLLDEFSLSVTLFTKCSVDQSRPVKMCERCVDEYIDILNNYRNLSNTNINGTVCIDKYSNLDRLEIVKTFKQNVVDLWERARCNDCYLIQNGTLTNIPSVSKRQFDYHVANFSACKNWYQDQNISEMCKQCMNTYIKLSNYYFSIANVQEEIGYCMDVVDWMNSTQLDWSLNCCIYRKHNEYIFIFLSSFICFLPILFYASTKYFGSMKTKAILSQNRFADSLNANSQSQSEISNR